MSETAAEQLRRILHLIPEVADGESHAIDEVAARLGVPRETLLRDLVSLTDRADAPGAFVEGVGIAWDDETMSVWAPQFLRPMRLTMRELCALELGLSVVRRERSPDERHVIDRALERLRAMITTTESNERQKNTQHVELTAAGEQHLAEVRTALDRRRKLRIRYHSGGATEATERIVCPYSLVFASGMWYVVGLAEESEGLRIFRLDRVQGIEVTDAPFEMPADFSVDELLRNGRLFQANSPQTMTVRYSPRIARWIAEREGKTPASDGSITIEHPVADVHWAVRHVLQYGAEAEVLAPAEIREAVVERLSVLSRREDE